jgi:hypothetical protein
MGNIKILYILKKWKEGIDWIDLVQNTDRWQVLVIAVMKFRVPWSAGNILTRYVPVSFPERTQFQGVS